MSPAGSITVRVWRTSAAVTGAALLLAGTCTYLLVGGALRGEFDRALALRAQTLASRVEHEDGGAWEFNGPTIAAPGLAYSVRLAGGRELAGGGDRGWLADAPPPDGDAWTVRAADGADVRVLRVAAPAPVEAGSAAGAVPFVSETLEVTVATTVGPLERQLAAVSLALLLAGVGACALVALLLGRLTRRALAPLADVASAIAWIDPLRAGQRLALPAVPVELAPVVERLDGLLVRLDSAIAHERAFSAAAAHELRTPLAGLQTILDVALARERDAASLRDSASTCRRIVGDLHGLVEGLLLLARADAGRLQATPVALDLVPLIGATWLDLAGLAAGRRLNVTLALPPSAMVAGDRTLTALVLRTLLDNAVHHADEGGAVEVRLAAQGADWELSVANTGCVLSAVEVPLAGERFWRGDRARSADAGHAGLGLALCRAASTASGARLALAVVAGRFSATVRFPRPPAGVPA